MHQEGERFRTELCNWRASVFQESFQGAFQGCAADLKCEDLTDIKNHELVYNDTIDRSVADDPLNYLTGHPLDTKKNRTLVWYGCPKLGNTGVASVIVKAFNGKRSDEASKKIRPIIGMFNSESQQGLWISLLSKLLLSSLQVRCCLRV